MLKRVFFLLMIALSLAAVNMAHAQESERALDGFGIGFMVGEPTGLSIKQWITEQTAITGGIGWSFYRKESLHVHADHIWHVFKMLPPEEVPEVDAFFSPYFGIGVRGRLRSGESRAGIRVPGGVSYVPPRVPLEVFFEIAPIMDVAPATKFRMNAAVGARFFF